MRQAESRMEKAFTNMRALAMHLGIDVPSDESEARRCSRRSPLAKTRAVAKPQPLPLVLA